LRVLTPFADAHGHGLGAHAAHGPEADSLDPPDAEQGAVKKELDVHEPHVHEHEHKHRHEHDESADEHEHALSDQEAAAQIIGVAILEFGVMLHR
jgi:zinc transporter 1/2/3